MCLSCSSIRVPQIGDIRGYDWCMWLMCCAFHSVVAKISQYCVHRLTGIRNQRVRGSEASMGTSWNMVHQSNTGSGREQDQEIKGCAWESWEGAHKMFVGEIKDNMVHNWLTTMFHVPWLCGFIPALHTSWHVYLWPCFVLRFIGPLGYFHCTAIYALRNRKPIVSLYINITMMSYV